MKGRCNGNGKLMERVLPESLKGIVTIAMAVESIESGREVEAALSEYTVEAFF